jgi:hypothetical protein
MEEKEDKGFVVRDRRKVSLDDVESEQSAKEPEQERQAEEPRVEESKAKEEFEQESRKGREEGRAPLPEVSFATFVFSLSSSALVHLGEIPEPESKRTQVDLTLAKQIIDTLGMLKEKTKGNLEPDEERLLTSVLYDLRMRFVQKSAGS